MEKSVNEMSSPCRLKIDKEFKELICPLKNAEFKQLEKNILNEGCREPIIVWNGIIIDGHNRYAICSKHSIPFQTLEKHFESREEVIVWICSNQLGRRNISSETRKYLIGKQYELEKAINKEKNKGKRRFIREEETHEEVKRAQHHITSMRIANEHNLAHCTVERYANYADAIERIKAVSPETASKILSGECKISHPNIVALSQMSPEKIKRFSAQVKSDRPSFIPYRVTTKQLADPDSNSECDKAPSVKDVPQYNPDTEVMGLTLTIPTWGNSIKGLCNKVNLNEVSLSAKSNLKRALQGLKNDADKMLLLIS